MSDNRANRIAKTLRAKARRKRTKRYIRPKRKDFRNSIMEAVLDAEVSRALAAIEGGEK